MHKVKCVAILSSFAMILAMVFSAPAYAAEGSIGPKEIFTVQEGGNNLTAEEMEYMLEHSKGKEQFHKNEEFFAEKEGSTRNANISKTITLKKGGSKTYSFTVNGGLFNPNHNSVSVVINPSSSNQYTYIFENVTDNYVIYTFTDSGYFSGSCTNMDPNDTYEITVINNGASDLTLTISITTYIS